MSLRIRSMLDYDIREAAEIITLGFTGYQVKIEIDAAKLLEMVTQDGIRIGDSRVVLRDDKVVAAALIARRGWSSRLAGMAVFPEARGQGVGGWLTAQLLAESKERNERRMELEVIESNVAGVRLYEKSGFRTIRRLVSFSMSGAEERGSPESGDAGVGGAELREAVIREVAWKAMDCGLPDLPWQVSGETLAHFGPPSVAYRMDAAYAVISDPAAPSVAIRSVLTEPQRRRRGQASRLLRALMAAYPGREWRVPALCPEEMAPLFESLGFARGALSQLHMAVEFTSTSPR